MRWIALSLIVALGGTVVFAGDPAEKAPSAEEIAVWIRGGSDAELQRAAQAAAGRDAAHMKAIFEAVRDQTRMVEYLRKKRVKGLIWEEATLDTAVSYLQTITGMNFYITPKVRAERIDDIELNLKIDDVSIDVVLNLITSPYELRWLPRGGVIWIGTAEEFAVAAKVAKAGPNPAPDAAFRAKIAKTKISAKAEEQALTDFVNTLKVMTGFNIVIDPRIAKDLASTTVSTLQLTDAPLTNCLNMVVDHIDGEDGVWTTRGNVIVITSKKFLKK